MDMLDKIYRSLIADDYIAEKAKGRIKFYEYPETGEVGNAYIVIDPLDVPTPSDFADDTWLTDDYLYQIDVWSKDRQVTRKIAKHIRPAMRSIGFGQTSGGVDEYDKDTGIFRDARRYRGKIYRDDYDSL